ncbi:hypothetical protein BTR22_16735 [Alkalihalophilus pseudofirmus]|uniref:hypothetical protein n=1 Tax=Alkalihalophilus pseudofirmus TaxID=79885 RepID=UPI00095283C2|nr:hypothetical protein BTR22_16735 [Alkalihalophilus pseudofirmus]
MDWQISLAGRDVNEEAYNYGFIPNTCMQLGYCTTYSHQRSSSWLWSLQGDVNWDTSHLLGGGQQTRNNANGINLNRTHNSLSQPETRALHEEVLRKHKIDFAIDMHQQVANRAIGEGDLVSGSLLYPTSTVSDEVLLNSKKLGAVVYEAIEKKGYGRLARYGTGDGLTSNARNHLATHYKVPTLLFEMRGMSDSPNISSILGQKAMDI